MNTHAHLDVTPEGREETTDMTDWLRHHDRYEDEKPGGGCGACGT
ncbi:DUF899 domain-containing protein [Paraburkholderia bryophila]|nr:DUF899 family protein [Paraburkholderia bryophila]WCM21897.1 DUF899 domain-containing protein [Paraburkholderia bryophila]